MHIGGDEVNHCEEKCWQWKDGVLDSYGTEQDGSSLSRVKFTGSTFMDSLARIVHQLGKKPIVWDDSVAIGLNVSVAIQWCVCEAASSISCPSNHTVRLLTKCGLLQ